MCERKPGPRCSGHTRKELILAINELKDAMRRGESEQYITVKREQVLRAREAWKHTPDGIESMRKKGRDDLAKVYAKERARQLASLKVDKIAHSKKAEKREQAAYHPLADCATTLTTLSKDRLVNIRRAVALNPNTDESLMIQLASDERPEVRSALATRQGQSPFVLRKLATDRNAYIRECVASHPNTQGETLKMLIYDPDANIRASAIASYNNLSQDEMLSIIQDKRPEVRKSFAKNGTDEVLLDKLTTDKVTDVREQLAYNPHISRSTINTLSEDNTPAVRIAVAGSSHCPPDVRDKLATDKHPAVALMVAKKSNNPETLNMLCTHEDTKVRHAAKMNRYTPKDSIEKLESESLPSIKGPVDRIERLKKSHPQLAAHLASS